MGFFMSAFSELDLFGKKKKIFAKLRSQFGTDPRKEVWARFTRERMPQIRIFCDCAEKDEQGEEYGIDDVTWADLEMDEVFLRVNHTRSYIGEQVLYEKLRSGRDDTCRENRELLEQLAEDENARLETEYRLQAIGKKQECYYLPEFINNAGMLKPEHGWIFRVLQVILIAAIAAAVFFHTTICLGVLIVSALVNFIVYMVMKLKYDILLSSMSSLGNLLDFCDWCMKQSYYPVPDADALREEWKELEKIRKKLGKFIYARRSGMTGDPTGILYEYLLGVTLIDVSRLEGILSFLEHNRSMMEKMYRFAGNLDVAISVASFRQGLSAWAYPEVQEAEAGQMKGADTEPIRAKGLYHPLIDDPVSNDFLMTGRAIITGANASGKSTFMKALGVNVILSQTLDTCCAEALSHPWLKVMTSMAIRDDVVSGESYYVREVRYLKRMLDVIDSGKRTLCIIDEILKGTNQKERLAASESVLRYIAERPGFCVIATHDMELVNKLSGFYEPYYFESIIGEDSVSFNYIIRKGLGGGSNALALLKAFGFPKEVLDEADQLIAASFTT